MTRGGGGGGEGPFQVPFRPDQRPDFEWKERETFARHPFAHRPAYSCSTPECCNRAGPGRARTGWGGPAALCLGPRAAEWSGLGGRAWLCMAWRGGGPQLVGAAGLRGGVAGLGCTRPGWAVPSRARAGWRVTAPSRPDAPRPGLGEGGDCTPNTEAFHSPHPTRRDPDRPRCRARRPKVQAWKCHSLSFVRGLAGRERERERKRASDGGGGRDLPPLPPRARLLGDVPRLK